MDVIDEDHKVFGGQPSYCSPAASFNSNNKFRVISTPTKCILTVIIITFTSVTYVRTISKT